MDDSEYLAEYLTSKQLEPEQPVDDVEGVEAIEEVVVSDSVTNSLKYAEPAVLYYIRS